MLQIACFAIVHANMIFIGSNLMCVRLHQVRLGKDIWAYMYGGAQEYCTRGFLV